MHHHHRHDGGESRQPAQATNRPHATGRWVQGRRSAQHAAIVPSSRAAWRMPIGVKVIDVRGTGL
jgi:hypothetical protein